MSGFAPIQGFSTGTLIDAWRAGRKDRAAMDEAKAKAEQQKAWAGAVGSLYGVPESGGVAGQFAPSNPQQPTFDQAFGGGAMEAVGGMDAGGAAPAPMAAPQAPQQAPARQRGSLNQEAIARMLQIDPETTVKIIGAYKQMDEMSLKREEGKNAILGAAAATLTRVPPEQRRNALASFAGQLEAAGWTQQELAEADLSDMGLRGYQNLAMAVDNIIDNELAEREFMAGKTLSVAPGGSVAVVKPRIGADGSVSTSTEYVIGGGGQQGGGGNLPAPRSKADFEALPPGSQFVDPNGVVRQKPGGQTGSAPSGPFPAGQ